MAHLRLRSSTIFGVVVLLTAANLSNVTADDASVGLLGGLASLIEGEDEQIVMRSGRVEVDMTLAVATVDCTFVFENTGPATTVLMGFPESEDDEDVVEKSRLRDFRAWVDGTEVETTWRPGQPDGDWTGWHTKQVRFAAGQTRVVRDTFQPSYGGSIDADRWFIYPMATGASWKGPIGAMEVNVHLRGFAGKTITQVAPRPTERRRNLVRWRFENIEPGRGDAPESVAIIFYPFYAGVLWNARNQRERVGLRSQYAAELTGRRVFIPVRDYDWILGAAFMYDPCTETGTVTCGRRRLSVRVGSREAVVDGKPWPLCAAPYLSSRRTELMVPLRSLVEALGGTVHFQAATGTTFVHYPAYRHPCSVRWEGAPDPSGDCGARFEYGTVFVPVTRFESAVRARVRHDRASGTVTVDHAGHRVKIAAGSQVGTIDTNPWRLPTAPYLAPHPVDGPGWRERAETSRFMVPLRAVVEELGGAVHYASARRIYASLS